MRKALAAALLLAAAPAGALNKPAYGHYLKALLLQRQGLYDQALKEYQAAAIIDPDSGFLLEQAAELALDIGQNQTALELAQSLVRLDPKDPKAFHLLGNTRWALGDAAGAKSAYAQALQLDPAFPDALYSMGNLLSSSDPASAKKYYLRYLQQNPDAAADVNYQIAQIDHRQGKDDEALKQLEKSLQADPSYLQARYAKAQIYETLKDTEAALAEYKALLPLDPQNVGLQVRLGEISFQRGDKDEAEGYFKHASELDPGNAGARFWLAFLAEDRGDFSEAAEQLSKSSAVNEDVSVSLRLSYYLTQANRLKDAVDVLTKARTRWPDDAEVAYFLALGYDDMHETEQAAETMKEAVRLKPDSRDARFQLGTLYEKLNRIEDSEREFRKLLEQKPDDAAAMNYLGYSLADRGLKLPEAERLIQKAVSLEPENGAYLDSLGWVQFKLGRMEAAAEELRQALRRIPDDNTVWEHEGDIQMALGKPAQAWLAWMLSQHFGGEGAKLRPKLDKAASRLQPEELGAQYLAYFRKTHDELSRFDALCKVEGRIANRGFSMNGYLQFVRDEDRLRFQVLGPFMVPLWDLKQDAHGTDLGGFTLPELDPAALNAAISDILRTLYAYFRGDAFSPKGPAQFKRGWTRSWVETDGYTLFFPKDGSRLSSIREKGGQRLLLELPESSLASERWIPNRLSLDGPGFRFSIQLLRVHVEAGPSAPTP